MKDSLFVLHELGEQLKQQVDASAAAAIHSDQLSLSQHLCGLEQALCKQQTVLQVQSSLQHVLSIGRSVTSEHKLRKEEFSSFGNCLLQDHRIKI